MDIIIARTIELLKEQNKTQKQLSEFLKISPNAFTNWKAGLNSSYKKYVYAIADFFNVSVEYLTGETNEKDKAPSENPDDTLMFALYGVEDNSDITPDMLDDIRNYAKYIRDKNKDKKWFLLNLNTLYDIASDNNIQIDCIDMKSCYCFSLMDNMQCYIAIDPFKIESEADEKVKLSHELGHCETGSFYNEYATCDIREKHEYRATKWQIKKLIPKDKLLEAYKNGISNNYELAEYFGVTEDFMKKAINFYCEVGKWNFLQKEILSFLLSELLAYFYFGYYYL